MEGVLNMIKVTDNELKTIKGGAGIGTYILIGGLVVFVIGIIDGYIRPLKCN